MFFLFVKYCTRTAFLIAVLVDGFYTTLGFTMKHYWCVIDGNDIDIGGHMTYALICEEKGIPRGILHKNILNEYERVDMDTIEEIAVIDEMSKLYNLYINGDFKEVQNVLFKSGNGIVWKKIHELYDL